MRIIVNDIAASSGGALSILMSFYNYVVEEEADKENEWIFLTGGNYLKERDNIRIIILNKVKANWINKLKFDLITGKKIIASLNPDIVFSLQNIITFGVKCPQIVYMHQSIPFQKIKKFSFFKSEEKILAIYQYIIGSFIRKSIKKADKIVVQTKWIRDAIIEFTKIEHHRIIIVSPNREDYSEYIQNDLFDNHSFFYPAAKHLYKNHKCIYDACNILKQKDITNYNVTLTIEDKTSEYNICNVGIIPFESILERYNSSTLIFPSYIESIGLPMVEARQMGTIILASDCPFSREVLEGYENAYFFNPFNPYELAELMERVINGDIQRKEIKKMIYYSENSWQKVIGILMNVFEEAI